MSYRRWSDEDLIEAVKTSFTKSDVIRKLGYSSRNSGNFQTIDKYIKNLKIDTSHFKVGETEPHIKKHNLTDLLVKDGQLTKTVDLKTKLIKANLLKNFCNICKISEWTGQKLNLHLDHINGDRADNRIENLRLLCPNCHSLTPTYCRGLRTKKKVKCVDCDVQIREASKRCQKCSGIARADKMQKISWPNADILLEMVGEFGYAETGRKLGVSDNAVRKRIKSHNMG